MNKILIISLIIIGVFGCATVATLALKPQMHKAISIEQIIYKRVK
jgi:uncharacterized protein YceK